ncbi:MAG: hypothetical protein ACI831_000906, partial [Candidatus Azotimanducaceae bacterium]
PPQPAVNAHKSQCQGNTPNFDPHHSNLLTDNSY